MGGNLSTRFDSTTNPSEIKQAAMESETVSGGSSDPLPEKEDGKKQDDASGGGESKKEEEEDEEEGECPFCLFMKGGECRDAFIKWEECVKEGEENKDEIVDYCFDTTSALMKCMKAHPDYYAPILRAEKDDFDQQKEKLVPSDGSVGSGNLKEEEEEENNSIR